MKETTKHIIKVLLTGNLIFFFISVIIHCIVLFILPEDPNHGYLIFDLLGILGFGLYALYFIASVISGIGVYLPFVKYYGEKIPFFIKVFMCIFIVLLMCVIEFCVIGLLLELTSGRSLVNFFLRMFSDDGGGFLASGFLVAGIIYTMLFSFGVWGGSYLYYKIEAKIINKKIKKIQNDYKK
jgi:hypothetical protein